jgi:hypothetical protein
VRPVELTGCRARLDAVARFVGSSLGRERYAFLYRFATPSLYAAAAAEPGAPVCVDVPGARRSAAAAAQLLLKLQAHAARLRVVAACLTAEEAEAPAWRIGSDAPPLAEAALHVLFLYASAHSATLAAMTSPRAGIEARHGGRALSGPERAHLRDAAAANAAMRRYVSRAQHFLSTMHASDAASYLSAQVALLESASALLHGVHVSDAARIAWAAPRAHLCSWEGDFWEHAHAIGAPAPQGV